MVLGPCRIPGNQVRLGGAQTNINNRTGYSDQAQADTKASMAASNGTRQPSPGASHIGLWSHCKRAVPSVAGVMPLPPSPAHRSNGNPALRSAAGPISSPPKAILAHRTLTRAQHGLDRRITKTTTRTTTTRRRKTSKTYIQDGRHEPRRRGRLPPSPLAPSRAAAAALSRLVAPPPRPLSVSLRRPSRRRRTAAIHLEPSSIVSLSLLRRRPRRRRTVASRIQPIRLPHHRRLQPNLLPPSRPLLPRLIPTKLSLPPPPPPTPTKSAPSSPPWTPKSPPSQPT